MSILDASQRSIFIHLTTSEIPNPAWGALLKSGSDGVTFVLSSEYVNRNDLGIVDFESFPVLDGIALVNVIADPKAAIVTGRKELQTRITHNDGESFGLPVVK